jgi:aspartate racemase
VPSVLSAPAVKSRTLVLLTVLELSALLKRICTNPRLSATVDVTTAAAEATADVAKAAGLERLGLLGTQFTMQASFYPDAMAAREIEVILPNEEEQVYIHAKYMDELVPGIILPETRDRLMDIIKSLKDRAQIDGAILGGTELSLILREETVFGVQILDTTQIHVEAAVARLISGGTRSSRR